MPEWSDLPSWLRMAIVIGGIFAFVVWHHHGLDQDERQSNRHPAPTAHQMRHHIRHARQDIALIAYLLVAILLALIWIGNKL
ncbi:hypothetical protein AAFN86_23550 [Roseomonas sp. CAU 1739]|uniref:hypothetical protein n=1 Tax=Roseomonas sp. CAU 1739 TaxID=3140364 RepID=UPI00325C2C51